MKIALNPIKTEIKSGGVSENYSKQIRTTCAYCGVGCGVLASVDEPTRSVKVSGDSEHPANFGKLCSKGSALGNTLDLDRRITSPVVDGKAVVWDKAISHVAEHFSKIIDEHGPDSVMLYVSGQLLSEDYYVANKFTKGFLGTNNIDSNSRLCMSSAVAGYKRAFGSDTVPCSYTDIEDSELFVIIGSNMAWCHPILFARLKQSKLENPNKKVVVIDPRVTDSVQIADLHLPLRGGTDTHLFNGLLTYLDQHGHADTQYLAHCDDLDDTLEASRNWTLSKVASVCGLQEQDVLAFYKLFANTKKTVSFYSMGVNQSSSGTDKVNSIINCHLYTGKMGYAGSGAFSITGQPNAMGGREVGALANLLASHFELKNKTHRAQVEQFWQAPKSISAHDGIKATQAADAILEGKIKAIWIMATNPVVSLPEADKFAMALKQCELVVVSDCSKDADTLDFANVILPAQGWSEKSGTVTNSERRISRQRRLVTAFSEAQIMDKASKPDWWIISQVAKKMGFIGFDYAHESEVFSEHVRLSNYKNNGSRSFNLMPHLEHLFDETQQISESDYDAMLPFQWGQTHYFSQAQLDAGHTFTDTKKLHFIPITPKEPKSLPTLTYPLALNTGRLRDQWHTMTRTGIAPQLNQHLPEPFVSINPEDAAIYDINDNDFVTLKSEHAAVLVRAKLTNTQRKGDVFSPMHWSNHFTANARIGRLIGNHIDRYSQQPEFKYTPVNLSKVSMSGFAKLLIIKQADEDVLNWLNTEPINYWVRHRQTHCSEYTLAISEDSPLFKDWFSPNIWQENNQSLFSALFKHVNQNDLEVIRYSDQGRQSLRLAMMQDNQLQAVLFVSPDEASLPNYVWLDSLFTQVLTLLNRKWLLAGKPASGFVDVGRIVCSCMSVGENTIIDTIKKQGCKTASEVGVHCKAGTNCGSCVSEINAILQAVTTSKAS